MSSVICPVEHRIDPERERRVRRGSTICGGCQALVERSLREMPDRYADLEDALGGINRAAGAGPVTGSTETRLPFSPPISDHLHNMRLTVMSWCETVSDERLTHGEHHPLPPSYELTDTCRWLLVHTDWCAGQGFAKDLVHEIRHLAGRARGLLDPQRQMNIHLGPCPKQVPASVVGEDGEDVDCFGEVWAMLREDDPNPWLWVCDGWKYVDPPEADDDDTEGYPRHEWPVTAWLSLGRQIMQRKAAS